MKSTSVVPGGVGLFVTSTGIINQLLSYAPACWLCVTVSATSQKLAQIYSHDVTPGKGSPY